MKKNPNSSGQRNSLPQLRGSDARKWRHQLASSSTRPAAAVRTLKFKLEFPAGTQIDFAAVRTLNSVVDGVGSGSLTGLLFAAHSSGFRLFTQEGGAVQFRQQSGGAGRGFAEALEETAGLKLKGFDPPGLQARFSKRPRARAGKDIRFVPEIIAREYAREFTGKALADLDPAVSSFFTEWTEALHKQFANEPDGWAAIEADPTRAAASFDVWAASRGWRLPSAVIPPDDGGAGVWKSCTLAFDPSQHRMDPGSPVAVHAIVAMRLQQLRMAGMEFSEKVRGPLQESITTQTSGGLSWLFGAGLNFLRSADSLEQAALGLGVPASHQSVLAPLLTAARAVPTDPLFDAKNYSDYRRLVGGRLDSWVANYLSRLVQLRNLLDVSAQRFVLPDAILKGWDTWFGRLPLSSSQVQALLDAAYYERDGAREGLSALTGESGQPVTPAHVEAVERYSQIASEAAGALSSLRKILEPDENDGANRREGWPAAALVTPPEWLEGLPKLNSFSGAIPDFESELADTAAALGRLDMQYTALTGSFGAWAANGSETTEVVAFRNMTARLYGGDDANELLRAEESTVRMVTHRFGRASLGCSFPAREAVRDFYLRLGVFSNAKDANRFFVNQQGALYRSPYSRSRHEPFALGQIQHPRLLLKEMLGFCAALSPTGNGVPAADIQKLTHSAYSIIIGGLTAPLKRSLFSSLELDAHYVRIPASLKLAMQADWWEPSLVARFFNLALSARLSMMAVLNRRKFFVRARFQRVGDTKLAYRPKDKSWQVPARLLRTNSPIGDALRTLSGLDGERGGFVNATDGLAQVIGNKDLSPPAVAAYLQQAPHDWFYSPGLTGSGSTLGWLTVDGKEGKSPKLSRQPVGGRLVGPPSFKSELDKLLLTDGRSTFGDVTLIFDQEFEQEIAASADGTLVPRVTPGAMTVSLAIPLTIDPAERRPFPYVDRVVSIDQGEAGIGFAVLDVRTRAVIESGSRRIPSIRRLINKAKQYRTITQKSQKFQQRFDSTMFVMRENVVGDVCHVICELMHAYKAFPVVESQVGNLEGGSRQLDLVYKAVNARFVYSDVPAHGAERKAYWMGGDRWEHPYLLAEVWEAGKKSEKRKPLNLFPGAKAPTAGTSQQCSECKRNPIRELRELEATDCKVLTIQDGQVNLPGGAILLLAPSDNAAEQRAAWRRNERLGLSLPISSRRMAIGDVIALARRNMRQAPKSRQSRDTTQSTYQCLSVGCRNRMHADENASRNIARRFLEEKVLVAPP
jgi:hypothetical protein